MERILLEPFEYLCTQPGKEIRTRLVEAFDHWLKVNPAELDIIKRSIEMLHNASLLIDDVEDESILRRGVPVAHKIFGQAQTINCANYVYFLALKELQRLQRPGIVDIFTDEMLNLHRGQGADIYWRDSGICPTEDEYLQMISNKTGGLLRLAVKLMQACSPQAQLYEKGELTTLVDLIGHLYQIRDDYINLVSTKYQENKSYCEDLTEGKFSFPIIHCIRADPSNRQLLNILKQKTTETEVKTYAVQLMKRAGSFDYTIDRIRAIERMVLHELRKLGGNTALKSLVQMLIEIDVG